MHATLVNWPNPSMHEFFSSFIFLSDKIESRIWLIVVYVCKCFILNLIYLVISLWSRCLWGDSFFVVAGLGKEWGSFTGLYMKALPVRWRSISFILHPKSCWWRPCYPARSTCQIESDLHHWGLRLFWSILRCVSFVYVALLFGSMSV